jgi:hypothetical protein
VTAARPILMSAPMVRGCIREAEMPSAGKSQTRRMNALEYFSANDPDNWRCARVRGGVAFMVYKNAPQEREAKCPYGKPGDLLWIRETFGEFVRRPGVPVYRADGENALGSSNPWRPSIHMPRKYSRLTLKITEVRVQRLKEISEADAIAEGIERVDDPRGTAWKSYEIIHEGRHKGKPSPHAAVPNRSPITSYCELWTAINGAGSWDMNPWIWALTFTVEQRNVDDVLRDAKVAA